MKVRIVVGVLILSIQLFLIFFYRNQSEAYFCWAPHDQQSVYQLTAEVNGIPLNQKEISNRYHFDTKIYWENGKAEWRRIEARAIGNVIGIIEQHELTYGKKDEVIIDLVYHINGGSRHQWKWSNKK